MTSPEPRDLGISEESEKLRASLGEPRQLGSISLGDKTRVVLNTGIMDSGLFPDALVLE